MSEQPDTLRFRLPSHADSVLGRMNALREERLFCDVTLLLRDGAAGRPVCFPGHKAVLAAASDFLRDQFLLRGDQAELTVHAITDVEVGKRLLLSCYTGLIEVPRCDLVTYLTVASALQMNPVVEKCVQVISIYFSRNPGNTSGEEEKELINTSFSEIQAQTSDQQVKLDPQQQIVEVQDHADTAGLSQTKAGHEEHKIHNDTIVNTLNLSKNSESLSLKDEHPHDTNCTTSERRESLIDKQQDDVKAEPIKTNEESVMEPEVYITLDMPKAHSEDAEGGLRSLVPKSYQCQECGHVFESMDDYVRHVQNHQIYQCLVCEKSFSQKSSLSHHHLRVHAPVRPYRCPLCHSTLPNKASLQYHISLHVGHRPFRCNCKAQNDLKQALGRHLKDTYGSTKLENVMEEADC